MATRIDFLGPPAVGKSTLCRALLGAQQGNDIMWMDALQAERRAALRAVFGDVIPQMGFLTRIRTFLSCTKHSVSNYLIRGWSQSFHASGVLKNVKHNLLEQFVANSAELVEDIAQNWYDPNAIKPERPMRYFELMNWIQRQLFMMRFSGEIHILADNSRLTRGVSELLSSECYATKRREKSFDSYCESILSPTGIVHIEGDSQLVLGQMHVRASESGLLHPGHRCRENHEIIKYTEKCNNVNSVAIARFIQNGIPVLTLNARDTLADRLSEVKRFLSSF